MAGGQDVHVAVLHEVCGLKWGVGFVGYFMHDIDWISKYLALFGRTIRDEMCKIPFLPFKCFMSRLQRAQILHMLS